MQQRHRPPALHPSDAGPAQLLDEARRRRNQAPAPRFRKGTPDGFKNSEYGGYVITDGSIYAPQMPWYMSHYCDAFVPQDPKVKDVQDPACYADYFSPMNNGFNVLKGKPAGDWPRAMPWQPSLANDVTQNHCASGQTKCTLALGGFALTDCRRR